MADILASCTIVSKFLSNYRMSFPTVLDLNGFVNGDVEVCIFSWRSTLLSDLSLYLPPSLSPPFLSQMSPVVMVLVSKSCWSFIEISL